MNTIAKNNLPAIGSPLAGGFYMGLYLLDGLLQALIRAPAATGFNAPQPWGARGTKIEGAGSFNDGLANTRAMAEAGCPHANWALGLSIDGHQDWFISARDEAEIVYRVCKPTDQENWCSFRDGDNPSSVPAGYPYTAQTPSQSSIEAFCLGGEEALEDRSYWTSTQDGPGLAWIQHFDVGSQINDGKDNARPAFAVRRITVTP
ncbi:MAG: DUF1566 domain-containing protein [Gammaproteobacteria bacterium]|uniref:DUF1566 domain-containing protein n=1 Tax=viral metagenome TaxID=1070528 RepID=A0A6M3J843_9ZZZZ|nr:DUF1566 domain-containing protein [Gammaproteobacteria bacterium]MBU1492256.1 DUF1566 domain-containing protein [Gammaproteobacteria bacterium]MBU2066827.1 DUF1566 domain-containing protein [Gammaproteobacteria bacterium]MBU2137357.1 DUF1566 domain-containing protein [Gammaproteobacteria bacterium]MBU2215082.1 DUF1566 domain-containing protein [Gammaproteobacteria bacterium]